MASDTAEVAAAIGEELKRKVHQTGAKLTKVFKFDRLVFFFFPSCPFVFQTFLCSFAVNFGYFYPRFPLPQGEGVG